jgi:phosphoribosylglycinamide formyltransferase-1
VTPQLDSGPRIVRARVPVLPGDDEASLSARVQSVEHKIYPTAVRWFCEDRLQLRDRSAWLDGVRLQEPVELPNIAMESSHV